MGFEREKDKNAIYRGDNTRAFNQDWLVINANIPEGWVITKAEFKCGPILKTYPENEGDIVEFPLYVDLSEEETAQLQCENECHLAIYDNYVDPKTGEPKPRKATCDGTIKVNSKKEVV